MHHHYADVEGHRLFYREAGPADAPASAQARLAPRVQRRGAVVREAARRVGPPLTGPPRPAPGQPPVTAASSPRKSSSQAGQPRRCAATPG